MGFYALFRKTIAQFSLRQNFLQFIIADIKPYQMTLDYTQVIHIP